VDEGIGMSNPDIDYLADAFAPADKRKLPLPLRGEKVSGNIVDIHDRAREVMRLALTGKKNVDIAARLGVTAQTVSNIKNSPKVIEEMAKMHRARDEHFVSADERLEMMRNQALSRYDEVLSGDMDATPELIIKTASEVLDRSGQGKITRTQGSVIHTHLTGEDIEKIRREIEGETKPITDVTPTSVADGRTEHADEGGRVQGQAGGDI